MKIYWFLREFIFNLWGKAPSLACEVQRGEFLLAVHVFAECLVDEVVFAPGAVEEAPDEGGGGKEDVAGHGPPEGDDAVAEAVENEGGGEPEDYGDEACGPHNETGVSCAFEGAAEDDVEGVAGGPNEEDEGEHFANVKVVREDNACLVGVEESQEGFMGEADKENHKDNIAETNEGATASCARGALFILCANPLAHEDVRGQRNPHERCEDEVVD